MILHHIIFIFTLKKKAYRPICFVWQFFFIIFKYRPVCREWEMPGWRSVNSVNACVGEGRIVGGSELVGGHNCHFLFLSAFAFWVVP